MRCRRSEAQLNEVRQRLGKSGAAPLPNPPLALRWRGEGNRSPERSDALESDHALADVSANQIKWCSAPSGNYKFVNSDVVNGLQVVAYLVLGTVGIVLVLAWVLKWVGRPKR